MGQDRAVKILRERNYQRAAVDRAHRQTYHEENGKMVVNSYQDVEPHLNYAATKRRMDAEHRGRFGRRGEFRSVLSPPFNVLLEVAQKLGIPAGQIFESDKMQRVVRELKKPQYKAWRTTIDPNIG